MTDYDSPELYSPKYPREQTASNRISSTRRCSASITAAICSYNLSSARHDGYTGDGTGGGVLDADPAQPHASTTNPRLRRHGQTQAHRNERNQVV